MEENREMIEELGQATMDEVEKLTFEPVSEVIDSPKKGGGLKTLAIVGVIAGMGAIAGYLYKRHKDRKWADDFDDGEDEYRPEESETEIEEVEEK